jgi:iron complex transport system substrate-binding protein
MKSPLLELASWRKKKAIAALVLVGVAVLTACSTAAAGSPDASPSAATPSAASVKPHTVTITDELGRKVELQVPIKAVYPDLWYQTEIVRAIGAGNTIVAVDDTANPKVATANSEYFKEFANTPSAGDYNQPNWEAIAASGAQVFFARRNSPWQEAEKKLAPFGIKVVVITTWDPIVLRKFLPTIGEIFGHEDGAAKLATLYDDIQAELKKGLAKVPADARKSVYFENNADFVTSLPGSGWDDTITLGGGKNIFADVVADSGSTAVQQYQVDPAEIIKRNPDVVIHAGADGQKYGYKQWDASVFQKQAQAIANRPGWSAVSAVKNGNVYVFNNFFYSALGKQLGALAVATWLYPDQFAGVDLDAYFARWLGLQGVAPVPAANYFYKLGS